MTSATVLHTACILIASHGQAFAVKPSTLMHSQLAAAASRCPQHGKAALVQLPCSDTLAGQQLLFNAVLVHNDHTVILHAICTASKPVQPQPHVGLDERIVISASICVGIYLSRRTVSVIRRVTT